MLKLKLQYFGHLVQTDDSIGKVSDAGKDGGQKEKRASEDELAGWHQRCNEHEPGQTLGDSGRQGGLMCCSPWGCKELDMIGQLNKNNRRYLPSIFGQMSMQIMFFAYVWFLNID